MNDDNKIVNQTQPQVPVQPAQPVVPPSPVGSVSKETGSASSNISEFVKPSGPEVSPNLPQEVSEAGVEVKNDNPNLTFEHKDLVDHAGVYAPISTSSSNKITMPMTEEEISNSLKTGQDDDSKKGLAKLIDKAIKALEI